MASNTRITTGEVRLSFANLFQPRANDAGLEKYSVMLLIPKSDKATIKKIRDAEEAAKQAGVNTRFNGKMPKNVASIFRDGDEEKDTDEYPEYAGHMFMTVSSNTAPGIVDRNVQPILDQTEVYSGCYARVSMDAYAYNYKGKCGVSFGLGNVQKLRDGEPFGAGPARPENDFEALDDEDDDILG